jgi:hypothetical protein
VTIGRAVTTAHVAAGQTQAQMYPSAAGLQTFLAPFRRFWRLWFDVADVFA